MGVVVNVSEENRKKIRETREQEKNGDKVNWEELLNQILQESRQKVSKSGSKDK